MTRKTAPQPIPYLTGECPDKDRHYRSERVYRPGHGTFFVPVDFDPATGRSKTMIQVRCPTCHLYKCWVPKGEQRGEYAVFNPVTETADPAGAERLLPPDEAKVARTVDEMDGFR